MAREGVRCVLLHERCEQSDRLCALAPAEHHGRRLNTVARKVGKIPQIVPLPLGCHLLQDRVKLTAPVQHDRKVDERRRILHRYASGIRTQLIGLAQHESAIGQKSERPLDLFHQLS